jgi:hypothetical protein
LLVTRFPAPGGETDRPSIAETKAIAEEDFIDDLPIVMNYIVTIVLTNFPAEM